MAYIAIIGPS